MGYSGVESHSSNYAFLWFLHANNLSMICLLTPTPPLRVVLNTTTETVEQNQVLSQVLTL